MKAIAYLDKTTLHGKIPNVYNVVNISSAPMHYIKMRLTGIADYDINKIVFLQLQRVVDVTSKERKVKQHGKKKECLYVVDDDDKNADNKIKNLSMINRYKCAGKLVINRTKPLPIPSQMTDYQYINVVNQHHTKRIQRMFNTTPLNAENISKNTVVRVIKTFDDHAGSINGILMFLNEHRIPSVIEQATVTYSEGWMTTTKKPTVFSIVDSCSLTEGIPDNDKHWAYKTGYDDKINTIKGPKDIVIPKQDNTNQHGTKAQTMQLNQLIKSFVQLIKSILAILRDIFSSNKTKHHNQHKDMAHSSIDIIPLTCDLSASASAMWMMTVKMNATAEIKKANRMLASYQLSKMMSKSGGTGDQTQLEVRQSDEFNSYLTGVTSYNLQEAIVSANRIAVKKQMTRKINVLAMLTAMYVPINTVRYGLIGGAATILPLLAAGLTDKVEPEQATVVLMTLSSPTLRIGLINMIASGVELVIKPSKTTRPIRMVAYVLMKFSVY